MSNILDRRIEFVAYLDVELGNPNGDPDAGNRPRQLDDGRGIITDVCLKRKVRDRVALEHKGEAGFDLYIEPTETLNSKDERAFKAVLGSGADLKKLKKSDPDAALLVRDLMCQTYFDVRAFGAVMTTFAKNSLAGGQVRGPIQLSFAASADPIFPEAQTITRQAITTEADREKKVNEMAVKWVVPYGLYRVSGFVSPARAKDTGFTWEDWDAFIGAFRRMFWDDRAASRPSMVLRTLTCFTHPNALGVCSAEANLGRVSARLKDGVASPTSFGDYLVEADGEGLPEGVEMVHEAF